MKKSMIPMLLILLFVSFAVAQEPARLAAAKDDTIRSVLTRHVGQRVTVKLDSGDELTGVVKLVGDEVIHLGELTGKEFFDAVIDAEDVSAVIIRVR